jgi:glycerol-3-phosphate O-acyltransferase
MLLKSFENLSKLKFNIKIVPVCINYDRIFDSHYLATEMISGQFKHMNTANLLYKLTHNRKGKLGKVFVKYSEPIDLNKYIQDHQSDT